MGIEPSIVGYRIEVADAGLGHFEVAEIPVLGDAIAECHTDYRLHDSIDEQIAWIDPDSTHRDPPITRLMDRCPDDERKRT